MKIVILNWRDIKNPNSGGAEILTHEIAKRLVLEGHTVIQFSSRFSGAKRKEIVDGVTIMRDGSPDLRTLFSSVHFRAYKHYKRGDFGVVDVFIDEIHGVPFFSPLYIKEKKVALICEYAGAIWDKSVAFPFNIMGRITEKLYPIFYKNTSIITISPSSKKEIKQHLFKNNKICIIHPGCSTPIITKIPQKKKKLTLIFIARLAKSKGAESAINLVQEMNKRNVDCVLHVLGRGNNDYVRYLEKIISEKNLENKVILYGYVSEAQKIALIDESHFLVVTSEKEGWGLTIHEVNSRGVPAVAFSIPGIRDVIRQNYNGILVKNGSIQKMADEILTLSHNKKLYNHIVRKSILERKKFTWDETLKEFIRAIST